MIFPGWILWTDSAIGLILGRSKKAALLGGQVVLIHVSPRLHKIFTMSGLYRIVQEAPDYPAALRLTKGE